MNYNAIPKNEKEKINKTKSNDKIKNLKSNYFLIKLFGILSKKKSLEIVKYNKNLRRRINIGIKNYQEYLDIYSKIEIEITPSKDCSGEFININKKDRIYFHIYFNDLNNEIKRNYLYKNENITKIKIIIDYQVKSFYQLFYYCESIESIYFKKFYRNNINNMSCMFYGCSSLKELNLSNFNTNNVTDMSYMFSGCSSLKDLNISNFNTINVTNMSNMFYGCSSLKGLNISNFNTNNVINMHWMFRGIKDELKKKTKAQYKNLKEEAFI